MAISDKEKQTIDFYDKKAQKFIGTLGPDKSPSFWHQELKIFKEMLTTGNVLDIGVGKGREAEEMINYGYKYTGIEPAAGLRNILIKKFPNQKFLGNTVYDLRRQW